MSSPRRSEYDPVQLTTPDEQPSYSGGAILRPSITVPEHSNEDGYSYSSHTPFADPATTPNTYPPNSPRNQRGRHVHMANPPSRTSSPANSDTERGTKARRSFRPFHLRGQGQGDSISSSRNSSWDLLAGVRESYDQFDSRNANQKHLAFAEGDIPKDRFSRFYNYLLNVSIVTRWTLFILPVLGLLWIPGVLGLTSLPNAQILGTHLLWWSIWFSVLWGGWWASLAAAMIFPRVLRSTIGVVALGTRRYIDWMEVLHRYVAIFGWTFAIWLSWNPLINYQQESDASDSSKSIASTIAKILFGLYLCAAVLLFEKFSIQWIAAKFHERSYAERIADQKFAVKTLTFLYRFSSDIPGRSDTLRDTRGANKGRDSPKRFFKRAMKGVRFAATTTTTVLGNVASEIAGSSVLQPNSPAAMVQTALRSANKTRLLARRLYYSFRRPGMDGITIEDIARFYPNIEDAEVAFSLFDKDQNGDVSRDEIEMSCLEFHREQLSIEHSMRDLDSAVGRLDNILMSVYVFVAILIMAVTLDAELTSLITGAGTIILGLSWLIGDSLSAVLTSIIFLFIKHPFDVGDVIDLGEEGTFTVKEIRLLSTIMLNGHGTLVQAPNVVLDTLFIQNIRRSPQMSEDFVFDVDFNTSFERIEALRSKMLMFVKSERRDYMPSFDIEVVDIPAQEKMSLKAAIMYKSNWQQGSLKAKRRNKWICALKQAMAEVHVHGPTGDPAAHRRATPYTLVPWDEVKEEDAKLAREDEKGKRTPIGHHMPSDGWKLTDNNPTSLNDGSDIFGEASELAMPAPQRGLSEFILRQRLPPSPGSRPGTPLQRSSTPSSPAIAVSGLPATGSGPRTPSGLRMPSPSTEHLEEIEMQRSSRV